MKNIYDTISKVKEDINLFMFNDNNFSVDDMKTINNIEELLKHSLKGVSK